MKGKLASLQFWRPNKVEDMKIKNQGSLKN